MRVICCMSFTKSSPSKEGHHAHVYIHVYASHAAPSRPYISFRGDAMMFVKFRFHRVSAACKKEKRGTVTMKDAQEQQVYVNA